MRNFKITFLPSTKDNFSYDELLESWAKKLSDSEPYLEVAIPRSKEDAKRELIDSEAVYGVLTEELFPYAEKIEWLQAPQAAPPADFYFDDLADHSLIATNFKGIYNDHISSHILAMILSFSRSLHTYIRQQYEKNWNPLELPLGSTRYLPESTILIIGIGGIGEETAYYCSTLGMKVIGIDSKRQEKPSFIQEIEKPGQLLNKAKAADFIVSTVPHTPETEGQFNLNFFKAMKTSAFFINIGRGMTTVLDDLLLALNQEEISGAGLDVYETEPLPKSHKLWDNPKVILTPHVAAHDVPYLDERRFEIIEKNCRLFSKERELFNIVDKKLWF